MVVTFIVFGIIFGLEYLDLEFWIGLTWPKTISQSILKACLNVWGLRGATKSHDFHPISNYRRVIDCQVLMEPTLKWSINYSLPNVKLCKRFHLSSQTEIENSFPRGPPVDPESLNGRKWKNKRKEMSNISIKKGFTNILGGRYFIQFVLYKAMRVKVVLLLLLFVCLFVGGGISQRPN